MKGDRVALRLSTRAELHPACRSSMSSFRKCRALDLESEGKDTGQLIEGKDAVGAVTPACRAIVQMIHALCAE